MGPGNISALVKNVLYGSQIVDTPAPDSRNSSYKLSFIAPQISCQVQEINAFERYKEEFTDVSFGDDLLYPEIGSTFKFNVTTMKGAQVAAAKCQGANDANITTHGYNNSYSRWSPLNMPVAVSKRMFTCKERHMIYDVTVTCLQGRQYLKSTARDVEDPPYYLSYIENGLHNSEFSQDAKEAQKRMYPYWNSFAILDTTLRTIFTRRRVKFSSFKMDCGIFFRTDDGKSFNITDAHWQQEPGGKTQNRRNHAIQVTLLSTHII